MREKKEEGGKQREEEETYKWQRAYYLHQDWKSQNSTRPSVRKGGLHAKTLYNTPKLSPFQP